MLRRLDRLPEGLQGHIQRVRDVAATLAARHGADARAVDLGAACHDLARAMSPDTLPAEARRLGLAVHPVEERAPILLHGPVAAAWLERDGEIADPRIIEAVRWHTTGMAGMGLVARVVFVADKIEPEKVRWDPSLERVAATAEEDLDAALLEYLGREIALRADRGDAMHPRSLTLRRELAMPKPDAAG